MQTRPVFGHTQPHTLAIPRPALSWSSDAMNVDAILMTCLPPVHGVRTPVPNTAMALAKLSLSRYDVNVDASQRIAPHMTIPTPTTPTVINNHYHTTIRRI